MSADLHAPYFGFTCLGFLAICVVLAVAIWIFVRSGEKGATKLNGAAGCAIGGALVLVAGLMALGCALIIGLDVAKHATHEFSEHMSEWQIDSEGNLSSGSAGEDEESLDESEREHAESGGLHATTPSDGAPRVELHVRFHSNGDDASEAAVATARSWLRANVNADQTTRHEFGELGADSSGNLASTVDIEFELSAEDAAAFETALREEWPDLKLTGGATIELRRTPH